jgi:hypothetical protein
VPDGVVDGVPVGVADGEAVGVPEGVAEGVCVGVADGEAVGVPEGVAEGVPVGVPDGVIVGVPEGVPAGADPLRTHVHRLRKCAACTPPFSLDSMSACSIPFRPSYHHPKPPALPRRPRCRFLCTVTHIGRGAVDAGSGGGGQ